MYRTTMMLAAALAPMTALAAEPALTLNRERTGEWSSATDSDRYPVELKKGAAYTAYLEVVGGGTSGRLTLLDPSGRKLREAIPTPDAAEGFEFKAPVSGRYTLDTQLVRDDPEIPISYRLAIWTDCLSSAKTECTLKPGQSPHRRLAWHGDVDWWRSTLTVGQSYTWTVDPETDALPYRAVLRGPDGQPVAEAAGSHGTRTLRYVPKVNGAHYLELATDNEEAPLAYRLTLTKP